MPASLATGRALTTSPLATSSPAPPPRRGAAPSPRRPHRPTAAPAGGPITTSVLTSSFVSAPAAAAAAVPVAEEAKAEKEGASTLATTKNGAADPSPRYRLNIIPRSAWPDGVPPVMGGHLLASGVAAPLSTSKGAGRGVYPPVIPYPPPPADASDGAYPITALVHGSPAALGAALVAEVKAAAAAAIKARGAFALAISGGSVHSLLAPLAREAGPDAAKWTVVLADERAVPAASPHCNVAAAAGGWAGKAGVAALLPTPPADAALASDAARAAQAAAGALLAAPRSALPLAPHAGEGGGSGSAAALLPRFDLVLLGIGDDGHVAGLFPNRPELASPPSGPWVLPVPVPSPTAPHLPRWSLSLPVLNAAGRAIVVAAGGHKATAVARSLETQALPGAAPAQLLRPAGGVTWMLDVDAAAQLHEGKWADPKAWQRNAVGGSKE